MSNHATCQHVAYRLTCDDYDFLLKRAQGKCEICRIPAVETPRGSLGIDHDHRYGFLAVRGLLCDKCNAYMRRVDNGERDRDSRVTSYYTNAWFVTVLHQRHRANLRRPGATLPKRPPRRES